MTTRFQFEGKKIDFSKGLVPAVVQDLHSAAILMVGYMNEEALASTCETRRVVFYSRSKERLWTKGETSGNFLEVKDIYTDCDQDALVIVAEPKGPTCHIGTSSCFGETPPCGEFGFLSKLDSVIRSRRQDMGTSNSYTATLFKEGIDRLAQKVGEEGVEVVIAAKNDDKEKLLSESADLLFHLMVLLQGKGASLGEVITVLENRNSKR